MKISELLKKTKKYRSNPDTQQSIYTVFCKIKYNLDYPTEHDNSKGDIAIYVVNASSRNEAILKGIERCVLDLNVIITAVDVFHCVKGKFKYLYMKNTKLSMLNQNINNAQ